MWKDRSLLWEAQHFWQLAMQSVRPTVRHQADFHVPQSAAEAECLLRFRRTPSATHYHHSNFLQQIQQMLFQNADRFATNPINNQQVVNVI